MKKKDKEKVCGVFEAKAGAVWMCPRPGERFYVGVRGNVGGALGERGRVREAKLRDTRKCIEKPVDIEMCYVVQYSVRERELVYC